jgi:sulfur relay (sulfurtransferase) DsrC/TusE family protein
MKERLTDKQLTVLCFVQDFFRENDQLPPMRTLAQYLGTSERASGYYHYQVLEQKGYIERNAVGKYRFKRAE